MGKLAAALAAASAVVGLGLSSVSAGTEKIPKAMPGEAAEVTETAATTHAGEPDYTLLVLGGQTVKWGEGRAGAGAVVRYAFVTNEAERPGAINCRTMTPIGDHLLHSDLRESDFAQELRRAMDDWSIVADIRFQPASDPATADLLIGGDKDAHGIAYADVTRAKTPEKGFAAISRAAICFNLTLAWENRFDGDVATPNVRYVAAHELGHVLGLDHAWGRDKLMRFQYDERFQSPQPGDIAGAAFLYGRRPAATGSYALIRDLPTKR